MSLGSVYLLACIGSQAGTPSTGIRWQGILNIMACQTHATDLVREGKLREEDEFRDAFATENNKFLSVSRGLFLWIIYRYSETFSN